jgi:epsin
LRRTLKEFVYVDETGKDVGANVRQKAKDITNLLQDEERLRAERRSRGAMRDRMLGNLAESGLKGDNDYGDGSRDEPQERPERPRQSRWVDRETAQLMK